MAVNDVIRIQFHYHAFQKQFITTFHYRETVEDTGPPNLAGINLAFIPNINPALNGVFPNGVVYGCLKANEIITAGARRIPNVANFVDATGTASVDALPGNTPLRVNLYGPNQDRTARGGLLLSGLKEQNETSNGPDSNLQTALNNWFANNLSQDLVGAAPSTGQWEFGFMSRAGANPGDPLLPWPGNFVKAVNFSVAPFFQTLRSRRGSYTSVSSATAP